MGAWPLYGWRAGRNSFSLGQRYVPVTYCISEAASGNGSSGCACHDRAGWVQVAHAWVTPLVDLQFAVEDQQSHHLDCNTNCHRSTSLAYKLR